MTQTKLISIANRVKELMTQWKVTPMPAEIRRIISAEFPPAPGDVTLMYNLLIDIEFQMNQHINKLRVKANRAGLPVQLKWTKPNFVRAMLIYDFQTETRDN